MTVYLIVALIALSTGLVVAAAASALTGREERAVNRQLTAIRDGSAAVRQIEERRRRQRRRDKLQSVLQAIGGNVDEDDERAATTRRMLQTGGIRNRNAIVYYYAARTVLAAALGGLLLMSAGGLGLRPEEILLIVTFGAALGWLLPLIALRVRVRRRQRELTRALPDALDLLVVCVEAGLGLNQAMMRVSDEMERLCPVLSDEFTVVGLEIRAGTARADALRNLTRRTGVADIQSLVGMLIQTERFGTSVARGLRVHSDSLRTKRRQRAEEQAAKTTIKMLLPLAFFIFPALFVVILGPAVFQISQLFTAQ